VGSEESKFGWNASDRSKWEAFVPEIIFVGFANLRIRIDNAPWAWNEDSRPFSKLRQLRDHLAAQFPRDRNELSMGTGGLYRCRGGPIVGGNDLWAHVL
jgi:hypothetical protein